MKSPLESRSVESGMTTNEQIADVNGRLQRAISSTGLLQRAGAGEKYLESYFLVEALELQLARLRQHPATIVQLHPHARSSP